MNTNEILIKYGIKTVIINNDKFLTKNGALVKRPIIWNLSEVCLKCFNVVLIGVH
jgi:hypothetical protein